MNWITTLGIILVAIGTFLTIYGSSISNKADLRKEIDSFSKKIAKAESETKSPETKEKVREIEKEFQNWAKDFTEKKNIKKIELEKDILNVKDKTAKLNLQYRDLYHYFFDTLRSYVIAYNDQNPNRKLTYEINNFPDDIFSSESGNYVAKVQFSPKVIHKYSISVRQPIDKDELPTIVLIIDDNFARPLSLINISKEMSISIILFGGQKFIYVDKSNRELIIPQLKKNYSIENYKTSLNEIIRKIMEAQLIHLKD